MAMNNTWEIEIGSPLLRPGITIRTRVSEAYIVATLQEGMKVVRQFNTEQKRSGLNDVYAWKGAWCTETTYLPYDVVIHEGYAYCALTAHQGINPATSPHTWLSMGVSGNKQCCHGI
jgi:hypothetical protein